MERFVQLLIAGGLALVAGLWLVALLDGGSPAWLAGVGLVGGGLLALAVGIWMELDVV